MPLTELACKRAPAAERAYKLTDGQSLYLFIARTGSKSWRYDYSIGGKRKTATLGNFPAMSLADARERRAEVRAALRRGTDPFAKTVVNGKLELALVGETFENVARTWYDGKRAIWAPNYGNRVWSRIADDLLPELGKKSIDEIEAPAVLTALRKVEARGAIYTARRLRQLASEIFQFAIASGLAKRDPAGDIRKAMRPLPRSGQRAALSAQQLPSFLNSLRKYGGEPQTALAIKLIAHTFVRTNELRHAKWTEFKDDIWIVPADRMKMRREHLVPLSSQAKLILSELRAISGTSPLVLPGLHPGKPISENTLIYAMYRLGYHSRATVHGFRATASTILNESGLFRPDVIERQLAHVPANEVRAAYNRAQYLQERRQMMTWWSEYLDKAEHRGRAADLSDLLN